jgi:A nuclease family of the HNH/ENDO VII superfamily with conserved AHH/Fibronectin type III domain
MQKKLHLFFLLLATSFLPFVGFGQTFPVTINTQFTQPSPIYLRNYADATTINSPIRIQLTLNDLTISNRQVRLKFYLQGSGISLMSNDYVVGASPLYLQGGFPTQLTNIELTPYFEFQNLLGINPNQYAQPLREGMYTLFVEVYDFATGQKLSRKTSATTILFQNEPPFLNLPLNKASIMQQNIQNITFSWSPRSINVSNVEYEFALVEITDKYTPVNNAFLYSPPLYTTTTRSSSLVYGIMAPQLIPGKNYAWRVTARALKGAEEIGVFKNNGNSEVFGFSYDVLCNAPTSVTTAGASQDQAKITWNGAIDNYDYEVKYREKTNNSKWYSLITPREYTTITNLKPKTTYEYTVGAACELGKYVHGSVQEFTTTAQDEITIAGCGIKPDPTDLKNKTPLPALFQNDVVTAGDFPIVVWHATGSNGIFSGDGYVTLPFLDKFRVAIDAADNLAGKDKDGKDKVSIGKYSRIKITFTNIGVNTDFKLISGEIVASYDPNWGSILDGDKLLNPLIDAIGDLFNDLYDLLKKKEAGTMTKVEFDKEWLSQMNVAQEKYNEIVNDPDIPETLRQKAKDLGPIVKEVVSMNYESPITDTREKVSKMESLTKEYEASKGEIEEETFRKLEEALKSLGTDTFIKCKKCEENTIVTASSIDNQNKAFKIKYKKEQYSCLLATINKDKKIDVFDYNATTNKTNSSKKEVSAFVQNIKTVFDSKDENILALITAEKQITKCAVSYPFDASFCKKPEITDAVLNNITEELQNCYVSELESITKDLITFKKDSRSNQAIEYAKNGKIYQLNSKGELEEVKNPLSDTDIRDGKWTDTAKDVKIRITKNGAGIYQYQAVGFRSNLPIAKIENNGILEQKSADLKLLADAIKEKSNTFFAQNNAFTTPEKTPKQAGLDLNDNQVYADGKKLEIDENARFFKISSEGFGLVTTLLKEGTIEEKTYLDAPKEEVIIKAPGIVTGSVEVVATKVTDLTTLATGIYDLTTDKTARAEAYKGLVQVKESIGNDAKTFIPVLVEVLTSAFSGNSTQEWKSLQDSKTDEGKKSHLFTRGAENTVITAVAGVAFVKQLPEMAEKVAEKIKKVKNIKKVINNIADLVEDVVSNRKNIRKVLDAEEGIAYARKYFSKYVTNRSFEDWWAYAKKYDLDDDLNFEVHHVIPVGVLEKNKDFQEVLLWAEKNGEKFDFNSIDNGIPLQKKKAKIDFNGHANHPEYDKVITEKVLKITESKVLDNSEKFDVIKNLIEKAKTKLESDVLLGNKDVNQILEF